MTAAGVADFNGLAKSGAVSLEVIAKPSQAKQRVSVYAGSEESVNEQNKKKNNNKLSDIKLCNKIKKKTVNLHSQHVPVEISKIYYPLLAARHS